jgi:hypothetical protein
MSPAAERCDRLRDNRFPFDDKSLSFSDKNAQHEQAV